MAMPWVPPAAPIGLPNRFAQLIEGLCELVAARERTAGAARPLIVLVWGRLRRLSVRFARLVAAVEAGRLAAPRPVRRRAADPKPGSPARRPAVPPQPRLPGGFGWLLRLVPGYQTNAYPGYLEQLLADPEMVALLAQSPQAGRLLRRLCQMLGVELPPALRLPPRKRASPPVAAIPDAPPPDAAPALPRAPLGSSPSAGPHPWPDSPELARLSDAEIARMLAALRADPPLIPDPDAPQPV
jgi:hypothetical protein